MTDKMIYEVCCGSAEDAVQAARGGADRIELNTALFLGGLTPSLGALLTVKRQISVPVMVMVRPREGGFCYSETEYETMKADAVNFLKAGADGLVFGFLNGDGTINARRTAEFVALCGEKEAVFSRAIDVCPDIVGTAHLLENLGIRRVLTSGGKASALQGAEKIAELVRDGMNLEILPGGGITPENVRELMYKTGVSQVHSSARKAEIDTSVQGNPEIFFGGNIFGNYLSESEYKVTDSAAVAKMRKILG
ncbi:MAG: copper homeostasis protein CutC [Oscillospiraceae bacterium]